MLKKEEKKKVGRPKLADDELKKKSIKTIVLSLVVLMLFLAGGTYSLFISNNSFGKLKGALTNSVDNCTIYVGNIKTTSADIYWACKNSYVKAKSITVYNSNSVGQIGTKIKTHSINSSTGGGSGWKYDKLIAGSYYVASIKLSNDKVINKLFKTPSSGTTKGDPKPSNITRVYDIGVTTVSVEWFRFESNVKSFDKYEFKNGKWEKFGDTTYINNVKGSNSSQYGKLKVANLSANTQYKFVFNDGKYETFTTKTKIITNSCSSIKTQNDCVNYTEGSWKKTCSWSNTKGCVAKDATAYKVVYNKNNRSAKGAMSDQYITHGVNTKLRKNAFKLSGYTFIGWRAVRNSDGFVYGFNKDGNKGWYSSANLKSANLYKDQTTVAKTVAPGATVTMYAQWKKNSATTTKKAATTKKTTTKKTTINKNKYFTVKFNANGGKGTMSNQSVMHGNYNNNAGTKLNANKFTKSGYTFIGWYAKRSADGYWYSSNKKWEANPSSKALYKDQAIVSRTVAPGAYVTMYAQWKKNSSNNTTTTTKKTTQSVKQTSKFIISSGSKKNCYKVTAPKDATYWRVHVYYKNVGASTYGSNKLSAYNHYNDGVKEQEVCFNKGNKDYRILVKKTTGANDKVNGNPSVWAPSGGNVNTSIGWAYKDYLNVK